MLHIWSRQAIMKLKRLKSCFLHDFFSLPISWSILARLLEKFYYWLETVDKLLNLNLDLIFCLKLINKYEGSVASKEYNYILLLLIKDLLLQHLYVLGHCIFLQLLKWSFGRCRCRLLLILKIMIFW